MLITGVRTLTQALAAPALTSVVSGSTANLSWAAPTPTGQSVIAGYRVYKSSAVGGPYTQLGGSLPSGQLTFTDTLSATSFYKVEAFDQFTTGGRSAAAQCTVLTGGQVKLPGGGGNGFWPNNQFWSGNAHTVYSANILPLTRNNLQLNIVEVALSWADMEGPTRGDYSKAFATIDGILADLAGITTHKVGLIVKGWLTYFGTTTNIPSRTSLACWPQYVVNNGWPTSFIQAGQGRSQLSWDIDDVWTALTAMFTAIGRRYDAHPNFLALGFQDETEAISQLDQVAQPAPWSSGQTVLNSVHYNSKLQQLFFDMSDSMPNTLTYAPFNFLPPGDTTEVPTMSAMINAMLSSRPGKWLMGGPDPWTHKTTFHRVATGLSGTTGDIRRQCVMFNNVEQGVETAGSTTAAAIYTRAISLAAPVDGSTPNTPGGSQILCWPYLPDGQSGQVITVTPIVNAIAANSGQVAPLPLVGNYVTS